MFEQHIELMRELIEEVRCLRYEMERKKANDNGCGRPLKREEAAEYLQVHKDTLYRWAVEEGRIAYSRLGEGERAPIRFAREDLDDFLRRQRIASVEDIRARVN